MFSPILFGLSNPDSCLILLFFLPYFHHLPCALSQPDLGGCDTLFHCGNITAGFPFWGEARPEPCGHPSLGLHCNQNNTLFISSDQLYNVVYIDNSTNTLGLVRQDFLGGSFCNSTLTGTTLTPELFEILPDYTTLFVYYLCDPHLQYPASFNCLKLGDASLQRSNENHKNCAASFNITVPKSYVPEAKTLNLIRLLSVLKEGFKVKLRIDERPCQECVSTGGICGYRKATPVCCKRNSSPEIKCRRMIPSGSSGVTSRNITIENKCNYTVWPGILTTTTVPLSTTGFVLNKGEARVINTPSSWRGRFWGRSFCSINSTGSFSCTTGDCGTGKVECSGAGGSLPATLAEFALDDSDSGKDFYDVSVVDGYNLPMMVVPQGDKTCNSTGCVVDLNMTCPFELRVTSNTSLTLPVACMNACQKLKLPEYCCTGDYSSPDQCKPTLYSQNFKSACPRAYSYAYDDSSSTFTCASNSNYVISFCPSTILNNTNISVAQSPFPAQTKDGTLEPPSVSQVPTKEASTEQKKKSSWKLKLILGIAASSAGMIIIMVVLIVRAKNARKSAWNEENFEAVVMLKRYSYARVRKMTNSFAHVLGKGGFGTVYKGKLPDGNQDVAVKILKETKGNGEEFINEVASMSRTSHVNIVSLLGFCYDGNKRAIIYEFMPNGSLDKFISENMSAKMEWEKLYDIALGVSRGLEYLHNRCVSRIVHFDIKPQNILMDKDLCPKISYFGLVKLCKDKESIISMLDARGTAGYIAPEVFSKNFGGVSHKSDVYSYGMVVLEMIGARNIEKVERSGSNNSSMYFPEWIYKDFERGEIMRIFGDQITEEEEKIARKMVLVGLWCIQTNPSHRPTMIKVIDMLEGPLKALQVPPKPLLYLSSTVPETVEDSNETLSFSNPSQLERGTLSDAEDSLRFSNT